VSALLRGKKVSENVSLTISPGSRQVLQNLAATGELEPLIQSGARILENACGPCIGVGQAPTSEVFRLERSTETLRDAAEHRMRKFTW